MRLLTRFLFTILVLAVAVGAASEKKPYFPETGSGAIHQRALELGANATVLLITLEPGYEDFPLLAHLRMGLGARSIVAYATYGSGTPTDAGGATPVQVSGERREEAYQASRILGTTVHFLNLQDPGVLPSGAEVEAAWEKDTVIARIDRMLRYFRPDVVILGGDLRGDTVRSVRAEALRSLVVNAIAFAADGKGRPDTLRPGTWKVGRIFFEAERTAGKIDPRYDVRHPVWGRSYRAIAAEASRCYRTLQWHQEAWPRGGDRAYAELQQGTKRPARGFLEGLPLLSQRLRPLGASIRKAAARQRGMVLAPRLPEIVEIVDTVDVYLSRHRSRLSPEELRLLVGWKASLEDLRCSLLDLRVEYAMSESLVTNRQLAYLKFIGVSSKSSLTKTKIMFPGARDHTWGINESLESAFDFAPPQEFRVITPANMDFTVPASQTGLFQSTLRIRFSFLLMHLDSIHQHEFYYRGEIPLRAGPRRTFEILTPIVRGADSARVIYRLINLSRDAYEGTMSISDSLVYPAVKKVRLAGKDAVLTDTLVFSLRRPLGPGDYPLTLSLSGGNTLRFALRIFDARVEGRRVTVVSSADDSPLLQALNRLGFDCQRFDPARPLPSGGGPLVLDRDATAAAAVRKTLPGILEWVRAGGHLVVFPQMLLPREEGMILPGVVFQTAPQLPPGAGLAVDTAGTTFSAPNRIDAFDWDGWVVSRSLCSIVLPADAPANVLVRSAQGNHPLLVDLPIGNGRVTVIALDLVSQFSNIHPGAHRLLANILAR